MNPSDKPSTKLLLDQGIPRDAAVILRNAGYDCIHVGEIGMSKADDTQVLAWARHRYRVVVTIDVDIRIQSPASEIGGQGIVRILQRGPTGGHLDGPTAANTIHRSVLGLPQAVSVPGWPFGWPSPSNLNSTGTRLDESFFRLSAPHGRLGYTSFYCPEGFNFVRPHARQLFVLSVEECIPEARESLWQIFELFGMFEPLRMTSELEAFRGFRDFVSPRDPSFAELRQKLSEHLDSPEISISLKDWARKFNFFYRREPADWIIKLALLHIELHISNRMYSVVMGPDERYLRDYEMELQQMQPSKRSLPLVPGLDAFEGPPWWMGPGDLTPPIETVECVIRLPRISWDPFRDRRTRMEMRQALSSWWDAEFMQVVDAELERIEQLAKKRGGLPTPRKRLRRGSEVIHFRWAALFQCGDKEVTEIQGLEENPPEVHAIKAAINEVLALVGLTPRRGRIGRPKKLRDLAAKNSPA